MMLNVARSACILLALFGVCQTQTQSAPRTSMGSPSPRPATTGSPLPQTGFGQPSFSNTTDDDTNSTVMPCPFPDTIVIPPFLDLNLSGARDLKLIFLETPNIGQPLRLINIEINNISSAEIGPVEYNVNRALSPGYYQSSVTTRTSQGVQTLTAGQVHRVGCPAFPQPISPQPFPQSPVSIVGRNIVTLRLPGGLSGGNLSSFTSWEVQWRLESSNPWQNTTVPINSRTFTLPGEQAGGVLEFRVRAVSVMQSSLFSPMWFYPLTTLPSACPRGFFGDFCRERCQCNAQPCNRTGSCLCGPCFTGPTCNQTSEGGRQCVQDLFQTRRPDDVRRVISTQGRPPRELVQPDRVSLFANFAKTSVNNIGATSYRVVQKTGGQELIQMSAVIADSTARDLICNTVKEGGLGATCIEHTAERTIYLNKPAEVIAEN